MLLSTNVIDIISLTSLSFIFEQYLLRIIPEEDKGYAENTCRRHERTNSGKGLVRTNKNHEGKSCQKLFKRTYKIILAVDEHCLTCCASLVIWPFCDVLCRPSNPSQHLPA